jgi:hypothetical protein
LQQMPVAMLFIAAVATNGLDGGIAGRMASDGLRTAVKASIAAELVAMLQIVSDS